MNNKQEDLTMSQMNKRVLMPKLRFPEFLENDAWTTKTLGSVATISSEKVGDQTCIPMSITSGVGLVSQQDKFGRIIAGSSYKNYLQLKQNDFAYNKSATKEYPEGYLAMYSGEALAAVPNSIFTCFRLKGDSVVPKYLNYLFSRNLHGKWLRKFIQVGARARGSLSIDDKDLLALPVPFPEGASSFTEQQKIADFLSSLDERISLEAKKLKTLNVHKSGMMQQLFPAEGETLPKLRFPEFLETGEWEEKQLSQLGELVSGLTYSPEDVRDAGLLVLRSSNVQNGRITLDDNVYVRNDIKGANPTREDDILICVRNGSKSLIGKSALIPEGMPPCTHGAFMTIFRAKSAKFIFQLFQTEAYAKQVSADLGATINSINGNQLKKYTFFVPKPPEQKKIADFLASLDAIIDSQSQKVDSLKTYKNGLMQQLFPKMDEVEG